MRRSGITALLLIQGAIMLIFSAGECPALTVTYSTFLGGTGDERGYDIVVDKAGNAYVAGYTMSPDFPTFTAFQYTFQGGDTDIFITKLNSAGNRLLYSTYLGGNGRDEGIDISVDFAGNGYIYLTGFTDSTDFPTKNAFQPSKKGATTSDDTFLTKLDVNGTTLLYSTYLGGGYSDLGMSLAVDSYGRAYVAGYTESRDFPTLAAYQEIFKGGPFEAFLTKFSVSGDSVEYSTYLGSAGNDLGFGVDIDASGCAYVGGMTESAVFPTVNAFQTTFAGGTSDAFITKFDSTGSALVYSTFLGGSDGERIKDVVINSSGCAYVTGYTVSPDFPTVNAFQGTNYNLDIFVSKFSPAGTDMEFSTYLGGSINDRISYWGSSMAVDSAGNTYIVGSSSSTDYPTVNAYQGTMAGGILDTVVSKLDASGRFLLFSTYLGGSDNEWGNGIAIDASGNSYITGHTWSPNFPTLNAYQGTYTVGAEDAYITRLSESPITPSPTVSPVYTRTPAPTVSSTPSPTVSPVYTRTPAPTVSSTPLTVPVIRDSLTGSILLLLALVITLTVFRAKMKKHQPEIE